MGSFSLLQGIFPTQGLNPGLPHCRRILYQLSHKGSSRILKWVAYPFSGGLPNLGYEPGSPALQADSLPSEPTIPHQMVLSTSCLTVCKMWKLASPRTNNQKRERRKRLRECSRCKLLESWKLHPTVLVVCRWSQRPTLIQCGQGPHKRCTSHCGGASGPPRKEAITSPQQQHSSSV